MSTPAPSHEGTVARTFLALGSGEAAARLVSFGALVFLARVLGVEAFGALELAAAIVIYGNRVADLGFDLGLGVREIAAGSDESRSRLLTTGLLLRSGLAVIVVVILVAAGLLWLPDPEGQVLALYALTLLAVGLGTRWVHVGLERSRLVAIARVIGETAMLVTILVFVRTPENLLRAPLARLLGDLLAAIILLRSARRLVGRFGAFDRALARSLLPRALPLVGGAIFGLMIFNSDLVILRVFEDRATVGYYAAAYTLIAFLSNLGIAYSLSLLPALTRLASSPRERSDLYATAQSQVATIGLAVATGGTLLAGPIISLVFGPAYGRSVAPLAILLWSIPLALLRDLPVTALMADGRERPIVWLTGKAALVNLALNFALVPTYGMAGAAVATLTTEAIRWGLAVRAAEPVGLRGPPVRRYARGIVAALAMGAVLYVARPLPIWVSIPLGSLVWIAVLAAVGGIGRTGDGRPTLRV